jgi:hypothetical protein
MEPPTYRSLSIDSILRHIPKEFTKEQNKVLMSPITQEEFDESLMDTPLGKAPWSDGFTSYLFHKCLSIIHEDVWEIIEDSRISGQVFQALNVTFLTLIPKGPKPTSLHTFDLLQTTM